MADERVNVNIQVEFAFEEISEEELKKELTTTTHSTRGKNKKFDDTDRTQTGWFRLPHVMGFCTVPTHDELQKLIVEASDDAREWREQHYPNRMTYLLPPYYVCRDCYVNEEDNKCRQEGKPAKVFDDAS